MADYSWRMVVVPLFSINDVIKDCVFVSQLLDFIRHITIQGDSLVKEPNIECR